MEVHHGKYGTKLSLTLSSNWVYQAKQNAEIRSYTRIGHEPAMHAEYNLKQASYTITSEQ
jgi:hypothetical protein